MIEREVKKWTFEELNLELTKLKLKTPRALIDFVSEDKETAKWACLSQIATDYAGTHLLRVFKKVNSHWEEIDVKKAVDQMAHFLAKNLTVERILKEVLVNMQVCEFVDLSERIAKSPKVTVGVQKGSCVYLYIRGKKGMPASLQITK